MSFARCYGTLLPMSRCLLIHCQVFSAWIPGRTGAEGSHHQDLVGSQRAEPEAARRTPSGLREVGCPYPRNGVAVVRSVWDRGSLRVQRNGDLR